MRHVIPIFTYALTLLCCWHGAPALAQPPASTGTLDGVVVTRQGTFAPNVIVTATNVATKHAVTAFTDARGYYKFPPLPPGRYVVDASIDGPPPQWFVDKVDVYTGRRTPLDIALTDRVVAAIDVKSRSDAPPHDLSTRGGTDVTFDRSFIDGATSVSGRTMQALISLMPGIVVTESTGTLAQYTSLGQRRFANRITVDGINGDLAPDLSNVGRGQGDLTHTMTTLGTTHALVTEGATAEVQVRTVNALAVYALAPGAQTAIITRAGGDRFSGSGFVEGRPNAGRASDWFSNAGYIPRRRVESLGSSLSGGGRIVRPWLFFFGSFERQRIDREDVFTVAVPSLELREAAAKRGANGHAVFAAFPAPNGDALSGGLAELSDKFPTASELDAFSLRLDAVSTNNRLFTRVHRAASEGDELTNAATRLPEPSYELKGTTHTSTATVGWNIKGNDVSNEMRANVTHHAGRVHAGPRAGVDTTLPLDLFIPPDVDPREAVLRLTLYPEQGGTIVRGRVAAGAHQQFQLANTLTYYGGRHEIRAGASFSRVTSSTTPASASYLYRATDISEFVLSQVRIVAIAQHLPAHIRRDIVALFAQDTFRMTAGLSLDYGIRYGIRPSPTSLTGTEPLLMQYEALPALQPRERGARLWKTSARDFNPHVRATWRLGTASEPHTVVTGGASVVADELSSPGASAYWRGYPYFSQRVSLFRPFPLPPGELSVDMPDPLGPVGAAQTTTEGFAVPNNLRTPYTLQWQFGLDRKLTSTQFAALSYVGAAGRQLVYWQTYRPVSHPRLMIHAFSNDARSDYHALLAEYRIKKRAINARITHTWSHAIDNDSGETPSPNPPVTLMSPLANRGNADFDRRHVFRAAVTLTPPALRLSSWLRPLGRGWSVDLIGTVQSGAPVTVMLTRSTSAGTYTVRPDLVPGEPLWFADDSSGTRRRLNPDAFAFPAGDVSGSLGRNSLRSSLLKQLDLAVSRTIQLTTRASLQVRVEAFNVLNIPNFGPPEAFFGASAFGQSVRSYADALGTGTLMFGGLAPIYQAGGPRSIQLALRGRF